jgi:hypothetical protein
LQQPFSARSESIFDLLNIFSDATDVKNTLVLLFLRHLIIDSEPGSHFKIQNAILFTKQQESCPNFAGELTLCLVQCFFNNITRQTIEHWTQSMPHARGTEGIPRNKKMRELEV